MGLDLKGVVQALNSSAKGGKNVDVSGKVLSLTAPKDVVKNNKRLLVSELSIADQGGSKIDVSVWNKANDYVQPVLKPGMGVMLLGVGASKVSGQVKLNMWEHVAVITQGKKVQSLTDFVVDESKLETLTSTFSPHAAQPDTSHVLAAEDVMPTV